MTKYAGRGLALAIGATPIAQITAMGQIGDTQELIDASAYGDDWKDYVLGQQDGTEVELTLAFDPAAASHDALLAAKDGTASTFTMSHDDSAWEADFDALITSITWGGERDGLLEMNVTLKIVNPGVSGASG